MDEFLCFFYQQAQKFRIDIKITYPASHGGWEIVIYERSREENGESDVIAQFEEIDMVKCIEETEIAFRKWLLKREKPQLKTSCVFYGERFVLGSTADICRYYEKIGCPCNNCNKYISLDNVAKLIKEKVDAE